MAVYGYTRLSRLREEDRDAEEDGLAVQRRTLQGYALMKGLEIEQIFADGDVSGSVPIFQRPEGGHLAAILQPGDIILAPKLDRLFRSALDALETLDALKKRGISLHAIDLGGDIAGDGIGRLVFTILAAVAEAERDRIRERTRTTKQDQKRRGRYLGGPVPFGYRIDAEGFLEARPDREALLAEIRSRADRGESLRAIANAVSAQGAPVSFGHVRRILAARD